MVKSMSKLQTLVRILVIVLVTDNPTFAIESNDVPLVYDSLEYPIVCFTPPSGCGSLIAIEISKAVESIYVQAYGFTSSQIAEELVKAHDIGVKVRVLLDKSNLSSRYSKMREIEEAGIDVGIDRVSGIAHNKVMIIDHKKVITGPFNFTANADKNNAENVLILEDYMVAENYLQNWFKRKMKSQKATKPNSINSTYRKQQ